MFRLLLILTFVVILPFSSLCNESTIHFSGQVVDSVTKRGIPFVTITVKDANGKVLKRMASDADGVFQFTIANVAKGELSITSVGYNTLVKRFNAEIQGNEKFGVIGMSEAAAAVGEVVVKALKPLVKIEPDKISYNSDADPETPTLNALDMMRKVPLLTVDGDDNIKLKGAGSFKILVNGKESLLMSNNAKDALKGMPASTIKRIEVITNPSSKYSAEGVGGIINIITNRRGLEGVAGNVSLNGDTYGSYGGNVYSTVSMGRFAFLVDAGHSKNFNPTTYYNTQRYSYVPEQPYRLTQNSGDLNYKYDFNDLSSELSYEIDTFNLISASITGYFGSTTQHMSYSTVSYPSFSSVLPSLSYLSKTKSISDWGAIASNVDYQRSFSKPDKLLTISYKFDYSPNNSDNSIDIDGVVGSPSSTTKSNNKASSYENSFQVDFVNPIFTSQQYEVGAKYILRSNPSQTSYYAYNELTNEFMSNSILNNSLSYKQNVVAAYAAYTLRFKKISFKTGVRLEGAYTHALFKQVKDTSFRNNLTDVVPYATISYSLTDASSLKFSYTQRLQRPTISYLNPYINESKSLVVLYGNPSLKTEKVNTFDVNYGFYNQKFNLDLDIYARLNKSAIQPTYYTRGAKLYQTYSNTGSNNSYGGSLYTSYSPTSVLSLSLGSTVEYNTFEGNTLDGISMRNRGWIYTIYGDARWTFFKTFTMSGYGGYGSATYQLQGRYSSYSYHGFALKKSFMDKKLSFSISLVNPFISSIVSHSVNVGPEYRSESNSSTHRRYFRFALTYRFGKSEQSVKKVVRTIKNDDLKGSDKQGGAN